MKIKDNNPEVIPMKKYIVLLIPSLILALFVWNPFQSDFVLSDFSVDDISAKESVAVVVLDAGQAVMTQVVLPMMALMRRILH